MTTSSPETDPDSGGSNTTADSTADTASETSAESSAEVTFADLNIRPEVLRALTVHDIEATTTAEAEDSVSTLSPIDRLRYLAENDLIDRVPKRYPEALGLWILVERGNPEA